MARGQRNEHSIRQSLLDRLIDSAPDREQDDPMTENQMVQAVQRSVRRDVENLLNTRYRCTEWPPQLDGLENSLVNYGLPDFTAAGLNMVDQDDFLVKSIENALNWFEPRLSGVQVKVLKGGDDIDRTFRFRIIAILRLESLEQEIRFDSTMETLTGQIEIG